MKRILFFLILILSIFSTAHGGYVIKGFYFSFDSEDLKNYTLTFYKDDGPISAASMHTSFAPGTGKNTIVVIHENSTTSHIFPILLPNEIDYPNDIEVRDFHYDEYNDTYVLCGSRLSSMPSRRIAFVAVINYDFTQMTYCEYSGADVFYSICVGDPYTPSTSFNNYYLCGTRARIGLSGVGVIASVDRSTLQLIDFYTTENIWEFHKIIAVRNNTGEISDLVASGRNPLCTHIGFTILDASFSTINSYMWEQFTFLESHCVVSNNVLVSNSIILASSFENVVTLNPITYPISPFSLIPAYRFSLTNDHYFVQDIGTILTKDALQISVAGFMTKQGSIYREAWHGYVLGLSLSSVMLNNYYNYSGLFNGDYEHYKIRYHQDPNTSLYQEYTGGYFQRNPTKCVLFGTPLTTSDCDNLYQSRYPGYQSISCFPFFLIPPGVPQPSYDFYSSSTQDLDSDYECPIFKGADPAPEWVMPVEDDNEIVIFFDCITVKDTPMNTNYQIYSVTGQLIQKGWVNPYISTASLSKGIYILRLENGKVFKFVKY